MQPFLKWAGGKRWLFNKSFIEMLPAFDRYIEPFIGGGAGFFSVRPKRALISDVNSELINLYEAIRDEPQKVATLMKAHQNLHSKSYYYQVRSELPSSKVERAARTLYLNRTCWNGLYRLNLKGEFNVPIGTKTKIYSAEDNFPEFSRALECAQIENCDFEKTIERAGRGDLIFVDPPYTVKHNMNGFVKYNESIFTWRDQIRLRDALFGARDRGAAVIITNANHHSVRELYRDARSVEEVSRSSVISGSSAYRGRVTELLVKL